MNSKILVLHQSCYEVKQEKIDKDNQMLLNKLIEIQAGRRVNLTLTLQYTVNAPQESVVNAYHAPKVSKLAFRGAKAGARAHRTREPKDCPEDLRFVRGE